MLIVHCNKSPIWLFKVAQAANGNITMRNMQDTISRLKSLRRAAPAAGLTAGHLAPFDRFGSNPGALKARIHVPVELQAGAPLVVVLHGCTQSADGYDHGAGWSKLADEQGFVVLFPEQQRSNNPNLCFNWFQAEDASRGSGEALSIRQMVNAVQIKHGTDPRRVFVTGLSAGGAMAAVMLATYPDLFAGGAVIAGLPYGTAHSVPEAFDRMRGHGGPANAQLADVVRSASNHDGQWPTLSVWHGSGDQTVDPTNATALVAQWRGLHGIASAPDKSHIVDGHKHRVWHSTSGRPVIEEYVIAGMAHGTPLDPSGHADEVAGPYMLDAGISSTRRIAHFWGIADAPVRRTRPVSEAKHAAQHLPSSVAKTIDDALRSAGLLR